MITLCWACILPTHPDYSQTLKVLLINGTCGMPRWGLDSWTTSTIDHVSASTLSVADNGESGGQLIFYESGVSCCFQNHCHCLQLSISGWLCDQFVSILRSSDPVGGCGYLRRHRQKGMWLIQTHVGLLASTLVAWSVGSLLTTRLRIRQATSTRWLALGNGMVPKLWKNRVHSSESKHITTNFTIYYC